jgi:hypothetical protein
MKVKQMCWAVLIFLWWGIGNAYAAEGSGIQPVGQWGYGSSEAVFINGNYAYIGYGRALVVLDVSDKTNPRKTSDVILEGFIESVYVSGNYAYIANDESGLRVVDISNAASIHEVGYLDTPGNASDVLVSGHYAFVADNSSGLRIINISNPSSPVEAGSYVTNGDITGVFVSGKYAYLCASDKGFRVIDISKPAYPREIGTFSYSWDEYGEVYLNKVCTSGNYAYVTSSEGLRIIDVSNPTSPVEVGFHSYGSFNEVDVSGKYVYTSTYGGIKILDVSNQASPQEVGYLLIGHVRGLHSAGNYVFAAAGSHLEIIDVTIPSSPSTTGTYMTPGDSERIRVEGDIAYMVNPSSGIRLIDISNPTAPQEIGVCCPSSVPADVFVTGNYAYAAVGYDSSGGSGLRVINVADPASPRQVGSYNCTEGEARSVWIAGNYAYLGYGLFGGGGGVNGGLIVIDITQPDSPQEKSNLFTSGSTEEFFVKGNYAFTAYLAQGSHYSFWGGMDIIDLSNPLSPVIVGTTTYNEHQFYGFDIHISGNYAYLVLGNEYYQEFYRYPSEMKIIDVTDPASPQLVGTHQNKGFTNGVYVSGNYTYTAEGSKGLRIINISRPSSPVEITYYNTPGDARDVFISGDYIFVADGKCGMVILKHIPSFTEKPFIMTDKTSLFYGTALAACSSPQEVSVNNGTVGTLNWTAAASQDWMTVTPSSGAGDGTLSIGVDPPGLSAGTYTGHVNIADPNASNSPRVIDVTLVVYSHGNDSVPFGTFETPLDGSIVMNSVPVTGWVLDDIELLPVQVYREPVAGEGSGLVYIGDAVFVEGARPDVEQAFPGYPFNYKAGWGYMMLTNFLPNGGNGTFILHAIATDTSGHQVTLGTKTVTCKNANAVKPFGAIDSPSQGGIASGTSFINWGWVLTPQPNSIPIDGSTINVWIDGVNIGHPTYNIYRKDIADLFPGYANSNGAIGYFYLDTTAYANGVHTIQWTARDTGGNSNGIGSRYFSISNSGARSTMQAQMFRAQRAPLDIRKVSQLPEDYSPVRIKQGFKPDILPQDVIQDENGMNRIVIKELDRIEVHLSDQSSRGHAYSGHLVVGSRLTSLPVGSTLDAERGIFYWQPGPGFLGHYHLVFVETAPDGTMMKKNIIVEIVPKTGVPDACER